ncbi:hypothetical protein ACR79N_00495 [Sphingobacterium siyangense]|uniref:Lipoprotein n=1 Tax=Sphingobacterium siyangense TaxID=459529 RepID=A0A562M1S6_9SPHI|nr:hypothetical protein [Sphingobacterium siyangense]TWI13907.1 hypothetical protein IQ31_05456 [Sphingobacterium siyangense]
MKNKILLVVIIAMLFSCNIKNNLVNTVSGQSSKNQQQYSLSLPDSLSGDSITGYAVLEGKIAINTNKIMKIEVMKLFLKSKNQDKKLADYYYGIDTITNKDDYNYMKRFKPFLEEYYRTLKSIKNNQPNVSGNVYLYGVKVLLD